MLAVSGRGAQSSLSDLVTHVDQDTLVLAQVFFFFCTSLCHHLKFLPRGEHFESDGVASAARKSVKSAAETRGRKVRCETTPTFVCFSWQEEKEINKAIKRTNKVYKCNQVRKISPSGRGSVLTSVFKIKLKKKSQ